MFLHVMVVHVFTCHGGSCPLTCHGGSCLLTCHGGSCLLTCHGGSCLLTCHGGSCLLTCHGGSCFLTCHGGSCVLYHGCFPKICISSWLFRNFGSSCFTSISVFLAYLLWPQFLNWQEVMRLVCTGFCMGLRS